MTDAPNPFEASEYAESELNSIQYTGEAGELDVGVAIKDGWRACWSNFGLWMAVGTVGYVATFLSVLTVIGLFLVVPIIMFGFIKFTLHTVDGDAEFGDLFSGFNNYGPNLGKLMMAGLLAVLGSIALAIVLGIVQGVLGAIDPIAGLVFGFILNGALAFLVIPRLFCWPFFLVDQDMNAIEALKASWFISEGQVLRIVGLLVIFYASIFAMYIPAVTWALLTLDGFPSSISSGGSVQELISSLMGNMGSLYGIMIFISIVVGLLGIIFYGAMASAYRQISGTRGTVESTL